MVLSGREALGGFSNQDPARVDGGPDGGFDVADTKMSPVVTHLGRDESTITLLRELVAHLRQNRTQLREEWARLIGWGVDGITTDFPDRLMAWVTARGLALL